MKEAQVIGKQSINPFAKLAERVVQVACEKKLRLVTVESCTAGRLAVVLTDVPGAGEAVAGGYVTYTKEQKSSIGVPAELIADAGVVSEAVAKSMADNGLRISGADISISLTGVAGPEPDDENNPVGLLYIGIARTGEPTRLLRRAYGAVNREDFMSLSLRDALALINETLKPY